MFSILMTMEYKARQSVSYQPKVLQDVPSPIILSPLVSIRPYALLEGACALGRIDLPSGTRTQTRPYGACGMSVMRFGYNSVTRDSTARPKE